MKERTLSDYEKERNVLKILEEKCKHLPFVNYISNEIHIREGMDDEEIVIVVSVHASHSVFLSKVEEIIISNFPDVCKENGYFLLDVPVCVRSYTHYMDLPNAEEGKLIYSEANKEKLMSQYFPIEVLPFFVEQMLEKNWKYDTCKSNIEFIDIFSNDLYVTAHFYNNGTIAVTHGQHKNACSSGRVVPI